LPFIPVEILPWWKVRVANKAVIGNGVRFRAFLGYQIVPNSTNFYQKRATNALEQADKGQLTGFFTVDFIKTCQVLRLVSSLDQQFSDVGRAVGRQEPGASRVAEADG